MRRVLAIDDDPAVTSVLKRGRSYEGFAVDTALSGEARLIHTLRGTGYVLREH